MGAGVPHLGAIGQGAGVPHLGAVGHGTGVTLPCAVGQGAGVPDLGAVGHGAGVPHLLSLQNKIAAYLTDSFSRLSLVYLSVRSKTDHFKCD